jgi:DNA repair exonuclease SbcCD ATPase subunit
MARQGLSEQQVFNAAQALLDEGQNITVASIRDKLGSGSYSTISSHLAKWREANDNSKPADIPEMPASVDNALRHVWALAWKEAQALIKTEREGLSAAKREIEREKKDMAAEIARLEAEITTQGDELKNVRTNLAEKEKSLSEAQNANNNLKIENARLDERVKLLENRAGELKEELAKLHSRLQEATAKAKTAPRSRKKSDTS